MNNEKWKGTKHEQNEVEIYVRKKTKRFQWDF